MRFTRDEIAGVTPVPGRRLNDRGVDGDALYQRVIFRDVNGVELTRHEGFPVALTNRYRVPCGSDVVEIEPTTAQAAGRVGTKR